jgi:ammonium transporter, Amt family
VKITSSGNILLVPRKVKLTGVEMSSIFSRSLCLWWVSSLALVVIFSTVSLVEAQERADDPAQEEMWEADDKVAESNVDDQDDVDTAEAVVSATFADVDTLWTCLAAFLVFFMQAGFAMVESGFTRAKNACNIMMKNLMDLSIGSVAFWMIGFGLMFGASSGWIGTSNFFYNGETGFDWAFLIFQTVFCATAATIVSGAMAERTKYVGYLCYTLGITVIVYPVFGSWAWGGLLDGGGWLEGGEGSLLATVFGPDWGFHDFAGSTVVHSIGGWAALAGAMVIGPRLGKYSADGRINAIPGHNIPMAALGVFILWLGWFGFNPGSTTAIRDGEFAFIAVTTNLAASGGAIAAMITSWLLFKKPDTSFALNGALAGLVGITAGCDAMAPHFALLTGLIAGVLVVFSVLFFDRVRVDDPVGAVSVHGVCGVWGTLAIGLFKTEAGLLVGGGATQFVVQIVGVLAAFVWAFPVSLLIFYGIKSTVGLRVSEEEEMEGLDFHEHGMHAYPAAMIAEGATGFPAQSSAGSGVVSTMSQPVASPEGA